MATLITELHEKTGNNTTDTIHIVTSANAVIETTDKVFVTPTEKRQIEFNKTNLAQLASDFSDVSETVEQVLGEHQTAIDNLNNEVGIGSSSGESLNDRVANLEAFKQSKNQANGIAGLDANGKILTEELPDVILGQLEYKGTFHANTGKFASWSEAGDPSGTSTMTDFSLATITQIRNDGYNQAEGKFDNTAKIYYPAVGEFWIIATSGTFDSKEYTTGDWIIFNGKTQGYAKVDNTDAVSAVAGLTGNITVSALKQALALNNVNNTADASKNVLSATKLTTARTINVSGDVTGTAQSFDGTKNIVIPVTIGAGKIVEAKLGDNAVTTMKIKDEAVTTTKLVDRAVTSDKLADNAIVSSKIASGAVTSDKLANSGVTAGTYSAVNVSSKGIVTQGAQMLIVSEDTIVPTNLAIGGLWLKVVNKQ